MNKTMVLIVLGFTCLEVQSAKRRVESEEYISPLTPAAMYVRLALSIALCCCGCCSGDEQSSDFNDADVDDNIVQEDRFGKQKVKKS
ncbi:hypothetical protein EBR77_04185 [bacterium]|nr:hypothetical protein [bacterium]NBX78435.1 hypothetical protein [bacterium]